MSQLHNYISAINKHDNYDYKMLTSASLIGSRGDEQTISKVLKGS